MSSPSPTTVLWPDLRRYGLSLTVAHNPSIGRNLLRLAVLDRNQCAKTSGLNANDTDFFRLMREIGFAYVATETLARRTAAYWAAQHQGASLDETEAETERENSRYYFYSVNLAVKKEMLKKIIPNLEDGDFKQIPISEIKHYDYRYLDESQEEALFKGQQAFDGAEAGVFYTTPEDRRRIASLAAKSASTHEIIFRQLIQGKLPESAGSDPDIESLSVFQTAPSARQIFGRQALLADGTWLRIAVPSALILAYPSHDDAVLANGGDVEGIERVQLPHALPIAFNYPARQVMVVKDGRYLEYGHYYKIDADHLAQLPGIQSHWSFIDRVSDVAKEFNAALVAGTFEQSNWVGTGIDLASEKVAQIRESMRAALVGVSSYGDDQYLTTADVLVNTGMSRGAIERVFGPDFMRLLAEFPVLADLADKAVAARDAEALRAADVHAALSKVQRAPDQTGGRGRREDAGEKIGGARKDYAKRYLTVDELGDMTARERVDVVTKDNIWPAPDYAGMAEIGVAPEIAYCLRELRSALPVNPYRGGYNIRRKDLLARAEHDLTLEQHENFVRAVSLVRDALSNVKTKEDLHQAIARIRLESNRGNYRWTSGQWFSDGAGYHFTVRVLPSATFDGDGELTHDWEFERFVSIGRTKTNETWDWVAKRRRASAPEPGSKKEKPEPEMPHLDHIERSGPDYRQGRDVDEDLLMSVFGFRAIEYGNWLPQDERQLVLNHTFDAFMDLASVLNMPPSAMSLGGSLALAFGARGRGGKNAARAHYEPARKVINLTRLSGAGSLAHEWGHAFDFFLASVCGVSETAALTERFGKVRSTDPVVTEFLSLTDGLKTRYQSMDEVLTNYATTEVARGERITVAELLRSRLMEFVLGLERLLPEEKRGLVFRSYAEEAIDKMIVPLDGDKRLARLSDTESFVRNLTTALDLQAGQGWREQRTQESLAYPTRLAQYADTRCSNYEAVMENYTPVMFPAPSQFLIDGEYFDSFRSKPYWSTRVEMFARAFESWVQDRIEGDQGRKSQYLVYGRQERPDADHSGYPRGDVRQRFAEQFSKYIEVSAPTLLKRMGMLDKEPSQDQVLVAA